MNTIVELQAAAQGFAWSAAIGPAATLLGVALTVWLGVLLFFSVGWLLSMSIEDPEDSIDSWGQRLMFSRPELLGHHQQIWDNTIAPNITEGYVLLVQERLRSYGWVLN